MATVFASFPNGDINVTASRPFVAFMLALAIWLIYFYGIDWLIMQGQGLAVGWNLMPRS